MENHSPIIKQEGYNHTAVFKIIAIAIFAALVFVVTSQIPPIPIPATSGYFNIGETTIYIAALIFGPVVGAFAGGIGSALSDAFLGFGLFAPGTFFIKGGEGLIVGLLNTTLRRRISNLTVCATISISIGGLEMVAGYFLYEQFIIGYPFAI
ncbi:MAG: ECF transporter S component, partial [Ignavibacteria bacterium]